jgi:hypothetical protein
MGSFPLCVAEICQILFHSLYSGENNKELDKPQPCMFVKVNLTGVPCATGSAMNSPSFGHFS